MDEFAWGFWVGVATAMMSAGWAWAIHRYFRSGAYRRADRRALAHMRSLQMEPIEMPIPNPAQENHRIWGETADREFRRPIGRPSRRDDIIPECYMLACGQERGHDGPHDRARMASGKVQ